MLGQLFHSLKNRDFRIYYGSQLISITGTWMQNVAQAWLVYRLTQSSFLLGLVAFSGLAPVLLFGLPSGVLADRYARKSLLVTAQTIAMLQAFTLAALTLTGHVQTWHIVTLAFVLGMVHAIEMPTRHSFLAELVPRKDLPNAIALNSGMFNLARFAGPAIAGWLVAFTGEGVVFLINGCTFIAVLVALLSVRHRPVVQRDPGTRAPALTAGLRYAWGERRIRAALLLLGGTSLVTTSYSVLMPVFSREVFSGGAEILGTLLGTAGAGALVGALSLAYQSGRQRLDRHIGKAAMGAGAGMIAFSQTQQLWLAIGILAVVGFSLTTLVASTNTLVQVLVPDGLRGRVMALFSVLFIGFISLGNLSAGTVAGFLGAPETVALFGTFAFSVGALHLWLAPKGQEQMEEKAADEG